MNRSINVTRGVMAAMLAVMAAPLAGAQTLVVLQKAGDMAIFFDPIKNIERGAARLDIGPHEAATSPDGKTVVACNYGRENGGRTLTVLDVEKRKAVGSIFLGEHARPHGILFFPDGERVIVTTESTKSVLIVNIKKSQIESIIKTDQNVSHMVALNHDASRAFVANIGSGSVSVLDLVEKTLVKNVTTGAGAEGIFMHPTRNEVWVTNRDANTVSVIDADSLEIVAEMECPEVPIRVAITPDGSRALVSCARSGDVAVFDVEARELIKRIDMTADPVSKEERDRRLFGDQFGESPVPVGIVIQPDGKRAWVANTNADMLTIIDLETLDVARQLRMPAEPDGMAWSPLPARSS